MGIVNKGMFPSGDGSTSNPAPGGASPGLTLTGTGTGTEACFLTGSQTVVVGSGEVKSVEVSAKAIRTDVPGEIGKWKISGIVRHIDGVLNMPLPYKTIVAEDDAEWDINLVLADNGEVKIVGTGSAGKTIDWTATVELF